MRYHTRARGTSGGLAWGILAFLSLRPAQGATTPQAILYEGFLTSSATGLPVDSTATVNFSIFGAAAGGAPLFNDCRASLSVSKGRYEVAIGSTAGGIGLNVLTGQASAYLEVDVVTPNTSGACPAYSGGSLQGNWEALSPRVQLTASPYSFVTAAMPLTFSSVAVVDTNVGLTGDAYSLAVTTDPGRGVYHLYVATTGLVGIGGIPTSTLTVVNGNIRISTTANYAGVLFEDRTLQTTAGSAFSHVSSFTANGTFTVPAGVTVIKVELWGGGGGGGGGNCTTGTCANWLAACSGGAGGYGEATLAVTPGASYSVTVSTGAAGGTGSAAGTSVAGGFAAPSTFGTISAGGGAGGDGATTAWSCLLSSPLNNGSGGTAASGAGVVGFPGSAGILEVGGGVAGPGGSSPKGGAGGRGGTEDAGGNGTAPGGGGGGGAANNLGGNGAAGEVIVYY